MTDNDSLAAHIASDLKADLLLLVSNVDGVYTAPPGTPGSKFLTDFEVSDKPSEAPSIEIGKESSVGTGGMGSKIFAAKWAVKQVNFAWFLCFVNCA